MIEVETTDGKFLQLSIYTIRWVAPRDDGGAEIVFIDSAKLSVREDPGTVRSRVNRVIGATEPRR